MSASVIQQFQVTIPANTALDAPYQQALAVTANLEVTGIRWRVPPGPQGQMGFQLSSLGSPVFPTGGGYVVADDEEDLWDLVDAMTSGAWGLTGYNLGDYPHSIYLTFLLDQLVPAAAGAPPPDQAGLAVA